MTLFDEHIKKALNSDIELPYTYEMKIKNALYHKKHNFKYYIKRFFIAIIYIISMLIGGFGVYAAVGGQIDGVPAMQWFGTRLSNNYTEYKQEVENQVISYENTSVELKSTLCSEGITILEFDVKLCDEDKEKFSLGQSIYNEEYGKQMEKVKEEAKAEYKKKIKLDKLREQHSDYSISKLDEEIENIEISDEELINSNYGKEYEHRIKMYDKAIEQRKNSKITLGLALNVDQKGGTFNYDKFNPNMDWYASIYIDDEPYYVKNWQKTEKVADNEYKIYTMYFLTESELKDKDSFKISLKNNKLVNLVQWEYLSLDINDNHDKNIEGWNSDCHWFAKTINGDLFGVKGYGIDLVGEYEVNVSKTQLLEDSKVMDKPNIKSEFRNITHTVEKVVVSPIQTVITVKKTATQQSSNAYAGRYTDHNIEHLPLTRKYLIYDDKGNQISSFPVSNKNTLIYSDGTREDYDTHDIPNKTYNNATWEKVQYILIENTDTSYIKIVPVEVVRNPINGEEYTGKEIDYEMEPMIINIK